MKNRYIDSLHKRILAYGVLSCVITFAVLALMGMNMPFVLRILGQEELGGGPYIKESGNETFQVILLVVTGIATFLVSFMLLMNNVVRYVKVIIKGTRQIADGDLSAQIAVEGNDELTYIAMSLNDMTVKLGQC